MPVKELKEFMRLNAIPKGLARVALLALLASLFLTATAAAAPSSPKAAAQTFYAWYLKGLNEDKDPMHDEPDVFSTYVSKGLIRHIERSIRSPEGMPFDYFLRAQDYMDEWMNDVSAVTCSRHATQATAEVTLGASTSAPYRLSVKLVREDARWKIARVSRLSKASCPTQ